MDSGKCHCMKIHAKRQLLSVMQGSAAPIKPGRILTEETEAALPDSAPKAPAINHAYDQMPDDVLMEDIDTTLLSLDQVVKRLELFQPIDLLQDFTMAVTAKNNAIDEHMELTKQLQALKQKKVQKGPQRQAHEKEIKDLDKKVKRSLRERHTADKIVNRFKAGLKRKNQLLDA
eukprot:SAG11_NODE_75_length_18024_cov_5.885356_3_plen_174_part_00